MSDNTATQALAVLGLLAVIIALALAFIFSDTIIDRVEVADCTRLKSYSVEFDELWLTEWQKEMCDRHGIEIDAPVGSPYE